MPVDRDSIQTDLHSRFGLFVLLFNPFNEVIGFEDGKSKIQEASA